MLQKEEFAMNEFKLHSEYQPTGDQPQAIDALVKGFQEGNQFQTLLGVTGSGKTFTMANVIEKLNKPTLVIAHNKTLAAQLYGEFKEFFPENAVEYFVSYYDYYQPEAYVPSTDTYIEKDSAINDEIDKLRHSATAALTERRDVIIVASVSCIYGLGSPIVNSNSSFSSKNKFCSLFPFHKLKCIGQLEISFSSILLKSILVFSKYAKFSANHLQINNLSALIFATSGTKSILL